MSCTIDQIVHASVVMKCVKDFRSRALGTCEQPHLEPFDGTAFAPELRGCRKQGAAVL